jgi:hypothetical protein
MRKLWRFICKSDTLVSFHSLAENRQMDIGVGSFVFSQGIVSAIPILKNPTHLSAPIAPKIILALRKSLPLLCLGLLRVLLVKGVEYPVRIVYNHPGRCSQFTSGTRDRVWNALEFLFYPGPRPCISGASSPVLGSCSSSHNGSFGSSVYVSNSLFLSFFT